MKNNIKICPVYFCKEDGCHFHPLVLLGWKNAVSEMGDSLGLGSQSSKASPRSLLQSSQPAEQMVPRLQSASLLFSLLQRSWLSVSGPYSLELGLLTMFSLKIDEVPDI